MSDEQSVTGDAEIETPLTDEQFDAELADLYVLSDSYFAAVGFAPRKAIPEEVRLTLRFLKLAMTVEEEVRSELRMS